MKRKNEKKKLLIEGIVIAMLLVVFAVVVVVNTLSNKPTVTLNVSSAQQVVDDTLSLIAVPTAKTAVSVAETANVTVQEVVVGTERDFTLRCTYRAVDVEKVYFANKEKIFSDTYAYSLDEKAAGNSVNATKIRLKMDSEIQSFLAAETPAQGEIDLHVYEIGSAAAEGDVMALAFEGSFLRVYLDDATVNTLFGGLLNVKNDVAATETVTYKGEKVDISAMNTLRTGIGDCFALRNFSAELPDTSAYFVSKWNSFCDGFYRNFIENARWKYLAEGLLTTLEITLLSALVGIFLGFLCAIVRVTHDKTGKLMLVNQVVNLYLTVIRGTPTMVQLIIIYFVFLLPAGIANFPAAVLCFGINSGAYVCEIVRGGIMSVDAGQVEAGRSLGLNYGQTMLRIVAPQAFKAVLPSLANEFITLLKESSVAFYIGVADLTQGGLTIRSITYSNFLPLIAVALIYLIIVVILTSLVGILERRLRKNER